MFKVEIDTEQLQAMVNEAVQTAMKEYQAKQSLPPVLTREEMKDLLRIKDNKASELLQRSDFPVIHECGRPRILTEQLFKWLEEHSGENDVWNMIS